MLTFCTHISHIIIHTSGFGTRAIAGAFVLDARKGKVLSTCRGFSEQTCSNGSNIWCFVIDEWNNRKFCIEVLHVLGMAADLIDEIGRPQLIGADAVHRGEQGELVHEITRLQHVVNLVRRRWTLQLLPGQQLVFQLPDGLQNHRETLNEPCVLLRLMINFFMIGELIK